MTAYAIGYSAGLISGLLIAAAVGFVVWFANRLDRDDRKDKGEIE